MDSIKDIIIFRIKYPNDPTNLIKAHQHFVANLYEDRVEFYTISSTIGKEDRIFNENGEINQEYEVFGNDEHYELGFEVPSFIDCSKSYVLSLDNRLNLNLLSQRDIPEKYKERIYERIDYIKQNKHHEEYKLELNEFIKYNPVLNNREIEEKQIEKYMHLSK